MYRKIVNYSIIIAFTILLAMLLGWYFYVDYWYRQAIPDNIGLARRVSIVTNSGIFSGCGIAVYKLDDKTYERIAIEGIDYFDDSKYARGHPEKRSYYTYGQWMETPRKDWKRYEDWSYQLTCGGNLGESLFASILKSGNEAGSFYASKQGAHLMVIPEERLVVFTYYD